jgi:penicillin-insensitive murein endopeptidase
MMRFLVFSLLAGLAVLSGTARAQSQAKDKAVVNPVIEPARAVVKPRAKPVRKARPNYRKIPARKLFGGKFTAASLAPRVYGFYTKGCLAGGEAIEPTGSAWQVMRPSRNRNWGHPELVALVKHLSVQAQVYDGWPGLLVGDLAQPRGGPMLSGHASHQIGLDADIWLTPMPDRVLSRRERETKSAVSVVKNRKEINPKVWTEAHAKVIRRAARYKKVARIFVHPPIKKALCDWSAGHKDRSWLRKVRPYYGHHYHFHIRINCPKGSPGCRNQPPARPADGTGCGKELKYWYSDRPWRRIDRRKKHPKIVFRRRNTMLAQLPKACRKVLEAD